MSTMFAQTPQGNLRAEQEFPPLLFSLTADASVTPRSATPQRGGADSMSAQRRSMNISGSVHTEGTPQAPPPPVSRLDDDMHMEDASTSGRQEMSMGSPGFSMPAAMQQPLQPAAVPQYEDVWVTIYGFQPSDVPLVLKQFSSCGDILDWGTFGLPQANFIHVKFQNKFAAQRALNRNGERLTKFFMVGVKPLDKEDRITIDLYSSNKTQDTQIIRPELIADRPYRLEASTMSQKIPVPTRSLAAKVAEFVFGI